jgi:polar amino acid transport system permease protein
MEQIAHLLPQLLKGALVTLEVTAMATVLAVVLSFVVGLARLATLKPARFVATVYVEVLRGTSAMVQLFYLFFIFPQFGIAIDPVSTAVIGLGLNFSAYGSEIVRTTVLSIERGQWEAAHALDMSRSLTLRRIVVPQALSAMLPPFGNLLIELLKATSLVSLITLTDLTFAGQQLIEARGKPGLVWGVVLVIYFLLAFPLSRILRRIERRVGAHRGAAGA